jgi:hypothetical protein
MYGAYITFEKPQEQILGFCTVHVWCMYGAFMTKIISKEEQQSILFQPIARPIGKQYE